MKNRKSISQAIIIQCCYKRYTAGSYAAENKSNVKMLQDKNKCDEATQKLCQVSYVFWKFVQEIRSSYTYVYIYHNVNQ